MKVQSISICDFGTIDKANLLLPDSGVVLVTGPNGSGKSTIVEAVAHALWGDSLRGAACWRLGTNSGVCVGTDQGEVTRNLSAKGKANLLFSLPNVDISEYATVTKRQEALESRIGTYDVWRNSCTFSSDDAGRFTRATDVDRKRLLESVLDLGTLDKAYSKALSNKNTTNARVDAIVRDRMILQTKIAGIRDKLAVVASKREPIRELDDLRNEYKVAKAKSDQAESSLSAARSAYDSAISDAARIQGLLTSAKSEHDKMVAAAGDCPTCGQPYPNANAHKKHVASTLVALRELQEKYTVLAKSAEEASSGVRRAQQAASAASSALQEVVSAGKQAASAAERNAETDRMLERFRVELDSHTLLLDSLEVQLGLVRTEAMEWECAARALSPTGARAALLDSAVTTLEHYANEVLSILGTQLTVKMASSTETKGGKVQDKISFDVAGAGGGNGYHGASSGERRRIDLAMLVAIGQLAASTSGVSQGSTLFFDELFDALDEDGIDAACNLLSELSSNRCVVVISHNKNLASRLVVSSSIAVSGGVCLVTQ